LRTPFPSEIDIVVIGAGAAGVAAGRQLLAARADFTVLEARSRAGGRAWTEQSGGFPLDLGCGWLHSAEKNPWSNIAEAEGLHIDRTAPPWGKQALSCGFPPEEQREFRAAIAAFYQRIDAAGTEKDRPLADFLEPGNKWNPLLEAMSTYINGVELDRASMCDYAAFEDSGINWRVVEGYGTAVADYGRPLPLIFDCPVTRIDHGGKRLRIETTRGAISARAAIITVPTALIAEEAIRFAPALPDKLDAAAGLPLGLANKAFLALAGAEHFPPESRIFGKPHPSGAANYHVRAFGRPLIEAYFGGRLARELEEAGAQALGEFAVEELCNLVGNDLRPKLKVLAASGWRRDPFARGSYSYALVGREVARKQLASPVDGRLFFAGEACSVYSFSTAHGAYQTGVMAAEAALAAVGK
jgi:monoamine oxidase